MPAVIEEAPAREDVRRHGLSLAQLWAFVAVALPVVTGLEARISTIDLTYQVRAGEIMLRSHQLIRTDSFTFTAAGKPWVDQQWAAQILLALLYRAGGWATVAVARAALIGLTFLLVYLACRAAGAGVKPSAWLTLGSFLLAIEGLGMRPQLIGMTLFALTLWLVTDRHRHSKRLWAVPLIVAAWANLHGSFVLGPLLVGLAWLEDRHERSPSARHTLWIALVSAAATAANPFGPGVWSYALSISTNPTVTQKVIEWESPTIRGFTGILFFASVAAFVAFVAVTGRRVAWPRLLALGVFFALGLAAVRGAFWWGLALPVFVVPLIAGIRSGRATSGDRPAWVNTAIAAVLVVLGVSFLPGMRDNNPLISSPGLLSDAPPGITTELTNTLHPGDRLFAPQRWGSWFEFTLPDNPVVVDSRIEIFSTAEWQQYQHVSFGVEGWQGILERWNVAAVVVHAGQQKGLIPRIERDPGWRLAYQDGDGKIFVPA